MKPEELVPAKEMCKRLRNAGYPQSATMIVWHDGGWILLRSLSRFAATPKPVAAPTLAEILAELPPWRYGSPAPHDIYYLTLNPDESGTTVQYMNVKGETPRTLWASHSNGSEAAAMLYLALKELNDSA